MRINIIPVNFLSDQHLIAEYREIKMLPKLAVRIIKSKSGLDINKISKEYTLNTGHGYFFVNKLTYIEKRFSQLCDEIKKRKFALNSTLLFDNNYDYSVLTPDLYNDYIPSKEEQLINIERIKLRINEMSQKKKNFYKFYSYNMSLEDWDVMYRGFINK